MKPSVRRAPVAENRRQIAPRATRANNPENRLQKQAVIPPTPTRVRGLAKTMRFHLRPLGVGQYKAFHPKGESYLQTKENHKSPQALDDAATELAIGWAGPIGAMFLQRSGGEAQKLAGFLRAQETRRQNREIGSHGSAFRGFVEAVEDRRRTKATMAKGNLRDGGRSWGVSNSPTVSGVKASVRTTGDDEAVCGSRPRSWRGHRGSAPLRLDGVRPSAEPRISAIEAGGVIRSGDRGVRSSRRSFPPVYPVRRCRPRQPVSVRLSRDR